MLKRKILAVAISLFLLAPLVFAQPIYTEKESYQVEVTEDGYVQVRKATRVYKDGVEISKRYHRKVLSPADDLTNEVQKVKDIANVVWTQEVINAYEVKKAKRELKVEPLLNTTTIQ